MVAIIGGGRCKLNYSCNYSCQINGCNYKWWKVQAQPTSLWASTALILRGIGNQPNNSQSWTVSGSFFWRALIKLKHLFHWSTQWVVGLGISISFWYDTWNGEPLRDLRDSRPRPPLQRISLRDAWPLAATLVPDMEQELHIQFNQQEDELNWRWSNSGRYSASSYYDAFMTSGKVRWRFAYVWQCYAPLKVRLFAILSLKDIILTHEVMANRGIHCNLQCLLCADCQLETANHLFFTCQYAKTVWDMIQRELGSTITVEGETVQETWDKSWQVVKYCGRFSKKGWASGFMCAVWQIWRLRNEIVFRQKALPAYKLANLIIQESQQWLKYCRS